MTDELRDILERRRSSLEAVLEWQALDNLERTGCRHACLERGPSTYCALHYAGETATLEALR